MIPIRIELSNFGAVPQADIDLRDITLSAVVGHNGIGKSTLFTTAPLWALFGVTRSGGTDDVIRSGESECSAVFTFEYQGQIYRVIRSRSNSGRGKSALELQRSFSGEKFHSLSGTTVRETQEKIIKLLNLDADTFTSTAMILQGRANEFTAKAPGQRKMILSQILGLETYERLEEGAKKHVRKANEYLAQLDATIERTSARMLEGNFESIPAQREAAKLRISELKEKHDGLVEAHTETKREVQKAEAKVQELGTLKEKASKLYDDLQINEHTIEQMRDTIKEITETLEQEDRLVLGVKLHDELKAGLAELSAVAARYPQAKEDFQRMKDASEKAKGSIVLIEAKIAKEKEKAQRMEEAKSAAVEYASLEQTVEKENAKQLLALGLETKIAQASVAVANANTKLTPLTERLMACDRRQAMLEQSGCINAAAAEETPCNFLKDAVEVIKRRPAIEGEMAAIKVEITDLFARQEALQRDRADLGWSEDDKRAASENKARLAKIKPLAELYQTIQGSEDLIVMYEQQLADVKEEQANREDGMRDDYNALKEMQDQLQKKPQIEAGLRETGEAVVKLAEFPALRERLKNTEEQIAVAEAARVELAAKSKEADEAVKEATAASFDLEGLKRKLDDTAIEIETSEHTLREMYTLEGALDSRADEFERLTTEQETAMNSRELAIKEAAEWETLQRAFSRNGIPALIIENTVPELERISNEILSQMSNGEHSLRFETQRELKSREGMAETLDIIVSDWQGERPYETFSGGEAARIDIAIRIAISELLANRAGSKVEWLTMDETFSAQDSEHKALVVDAIKRVSDRFKKVIVITHDDSLIGSFPQLISVSRNEERLSIEIS